MDAFAELGLTPTFELSIAELEARYLALLAELHPDRFIDTMSAEKALAETKAAAVNHAYYLLKSPASRARCLLEDQGIDLAGAESKSPETTAILFEIMTLREHYATLKKPEDIAAFDADAQQRLREACTLFAESLQQGNPIPAYLRLTYLDKIVDEIKHMKRL
jgi:molecular chaperone HscB